MSPMNKDWQNQIRKRFPDWHTSEMILRWLEVARSDDRPYVGDLVSGDVITNSPLGVWVDINCGFPALLPFENMLDAQAQFITSDEYQTLGSIVHGEISSLEIDGEIRLIQLPYPRAVT